MAVKNMAASVLARLKQQAKQQNIPFQLALQLFAQEEFLRKLSMSDYAGNFILKGGMFIYTLTDFEARPTRDVDFLLRNLNGETAYIHSVLKSICDIQTENDFITIELLHSKTITVDKQYPGTKSSFMAHIDNVRIPFSIDIGIDDVIVPKPISRSIPPRLPNFSAPTLLTYTLESTIAEKLDAIFQRMSATSRMKDFYDIYYLSGLLDFDGALLCAAVSATLTHRNHEADPDAFVQINKFRNNPFLITQWQAFEPARRTGLDFSIVIDHLITFLEPVYTAYLKKEPFTKHWSHEISTWKNAAH